MTYDDLRAAMPTLDREATEELRSAVGHLLAEKNADGVQARMATAVGVPFTLWLAHELARAGEGLTSTNDIAAGAAAQFANLIVAMTAILGRDGREAKFTRALLATICAETGIRLSGARGPTDADVGADDEQADA